MPRRPVFLLMIMTPLLLTSCGGGGAPDPALVFTPAHRTLRHALGDFFNVRGGPPAQPIPFPHETHITKAELTCTDYCHESAAKGPIAGLPRVTTCMICHDAIATDRPLIQQVAAYARRKADIPWQRVYGFAQPSHVRFQHAPHLRAKVDCATCHGDVARQTVAERVVDHTMGFCVKCHKTTQASNDCLTCHF